MSRLNVTLLALLALLLSLVVVNDSWGQIIDNEDIFNFFIVNETNVFPVENGMTFVGDILIPPPDIGENSLNADTYTIEFSAEDFPNGLSVTFQNSLTILQREAQLGGQCTGRIQALGEPGNVVTMTGVGENAWGGIVIETDPGNWGQGFRNGNYIGYCEISNMFNWFQGGIRIDFAVNESVQAFIEGCIITESFGGPAIFANGGNYLIQGNEIFGCNGGIMCSNPTAWDPEDLLDAQMLRKIIANNYLHDNFEASGIWMTDNWSGHIVSNITQNNMVWGIQVVDCPDAVIVNNSVIDENQGIIVWNDWCNVSNNIVVTSNTGVVYVGQDNAEVEFGLFSGNNQNSQNVFIDPNQCVFDPPQFKDVTLIPVDAHLLWTSPAINRGDPAPEFNDPDGSINDLGAFGGPRAGGFLLFEENDDYCLIEDDEWEDFVELIRDTYRVTNRIDVEEISIEAGTRLQFAQGVCFAMRSGAQAIIGDLDGDPVYFEPIPNTDPITTWSGIWSENQGDGLEMYNCDITGVAVEDTAALTIWGGSDVILQRLNVHDNSADGGIWLWGGNVMLGGDPLDIDEWEGEGNLVENNTGYGVCLQQYTLGNAYIYGNVIRGNGSIDDDETHCGLQLISSKPIFSTTAGAGGLNYITENLVTGIYWVDSYPVWGAVHAAADVIAGNGRDLLLQAGGLGAEIYVDGAAATMNIKACDIYDEQGDPAVRDGILVFNFSASPFNAQGNFWGYAAINPLDPPFVGGVDFTNPLQDPNDEDFYEDIAGIANINVFWAALSAFESENWESAIRLCYQFIGEEPNNAYAPQALDIIEACLLHTNGNFSAYREYCLDLASEQSETAAGMAARWMAIECLAANEDIQGAMSEYQEIAANAQNANE